MREAAPILLDPEEHYLIAPTHTTEIIRDLARRSLADSDKPNPPLSHITTTREVLDMYTPTDPVTLLLVLTAYAQLKPTEDGDEVRMTKEVEDKILTFVRAYDKWQLCEANDRPQKPGDQDWGLIRTSVADRVAEGREYLTLRIPDAKVTIKSLDKLIHLIETGRATIELDLLDWYANQPTPCAARFHRTRLFNHLQAITNPVVPIVPLADAPSSKSLAFPLLDIFLRPALVHHPLDPLVNLFVLRAYQLLASSPSASSSDKDKAKAAIEARLAVLESAQKAWDGSEYRDSLKLAKGDGARVRMAYASECSKELVRAKMMSFEQTKMWDVVFGRVPDPSKGTKKDRQAEAQWDIDNVEVKGDMGEYSPPEPKEE